MDENLGLENSRIYTRNGWLSFLEYKYIIQ